LFIFLHFTDERVDASFSKALQKARLAKKMNQKQLAQMINEKPQVVNEYESGKAIPNGAVINKLNRALGCQLPSAKGKKKPAPKKK
jgi:putative transcription factor